MNGAVCGDFYERPTHYIAQDPRMPAFRRSGYRRHTPGSRLQITPGLASWTKAYQYLELESHSYAANCLNNIVITSIKSHIKIRNTWPENGSNLYLLSVYWCSLLFTARCSKHARYMPSPCACVYLCLSVTSRSSTKTAKLRITKTTPHDIAGNLVFWCQRFPRNSTGVTP